MIAELLRWLREPEVIGQPECPLIHRWTFGGEQRSRTWPMKLMVHHFLPTSRDRDPHDHPRPFWTFVVWGEYVNEEVPGGESFSRAEAMRGDISPDGDLVRRERMTPGTLRYRRARHTHRTWTGERGAWTIVLMGPERRPWGFWRDGKWWRHKAYEAAFGHGFRC